MESATALTAASIWFLLTASVPATAWLTPEITLLPALMPVDVTDGPPEIVKPLVFIMVLPALILLPETSPVVPFKTIWLAPVPTVTLSAVSWSVVPTVIVVPVCVRLIFLPSLNVTLLPPETFWAAPELTAKFHAEPSLAWLIAVATFWAVANPSAPDRDAVPDASLWIVPFVVLIVTVLPAIEVVI